MLYRCVNCGGNVVYDPAKKKMVCLSCGGSDCQELVPSQEPVICINCGSQIPYTEYQSAGRCPSCGTYLLRDDKVNYPYGADVILPFKISKHEAEEKLRNEFGKKLFIPGTFLSQKTLEALKGVYVPFWMYDYDSDVAYEAIGTKVRSWTSGDKRYTETSYFDVGRSLHVNYEGIAVDASIAMEDGIPFVIIFYVINKYVQAVVSVDGGDMLDKCVKAFSLIFQVKPYFAPSFKLTPLICGIGAGVAFKLFMNSRKKNAKQFRPREEYGSAKWGTDKDFEPYTDPVKWNNIPLTATEWLRMTRPEHPKYDRNKNILIVGGSGAGKTRGFVKPSLMQMQCSYVVTDPKGTVLEEVGTMLARGAWELDDKGNKVPKVGKNGQTLKTKSGKVIYKRTPYKIKVFNTINFAKSMHYNPFAYIHTEQDVLKFVNTLIANTKGEGAQSGEDFWVKAERLLFTAYVAYVVKYCKKSERNFVSLLAMIDASETREEDEDFENAIDLMFKDIEFGNDEEGIEADPDSFAVRQYHKYKLAAGVIR